MIEATFTVLVRLEKPPAKLCRGGVTMNDEQVKEALIARIRAGLAAAWPYPEVFDVNVKCEGIL